MNDTKGTAILQNSFLKFGPYKGTLKKTYRGALVASSEGVVTNFALKEAEKFGSLFVQ
jgi:GTP-binding protein